MSSSLLAGFGRPSLLSCRRSTPMPCCRACSIPCSSKAGPTGSRFHRWPLRRAPPVADPVLCWRSRCRWVEQSPAEAGIFGAMNQGFARLALDWPLFWGSDDWAATPTCWTAWRLLSNRRHPRHHTDLLVRRGRYADPSGGLARPPCSRPLAAQCAAHRRAPLLGSTSRTRPPCSGPSPPAPGALCPRPSLG